jgi:hypothetical protein
MLTAAIDLQFAIGGTAQAVVRNHAAYGALDQELRMPLLAGGEILRLMAADISGEAHIGLLNILLAAYTHLFRIDDDHKITGVNMRSKNHFAFAAKQVGCLDGHMSKMLFRRVDYPPIALYIGRLC